MADFEIMENPEYTDQIRKFEPTDPAHADLFNSVTEKMVNNDAFLKRELDRQGTGTQEQFQQQYEQLTGYTDQKIAQLIGGAPETMDTLKEVADAIAENETVVEALNEAIGKKMDKSEAMAQGGDSKDNYTTFVSEDNASPSSWTDVPVLGSGERHSSIFNKMSTMFKNIRWIYKKLGTTDISSIGGGTVTGAISKLNTDLSGKQNNVTGAAATIVSSRLTPDRLLMSDSEGYVSSTGTSLNDFNSMKNEISNEYQKAGTLTMYNIVMNGFVTTSGMEIDVFLTVPKKTSNVSVTNIKADRSWIRGIAGYVGGSAISISKGAAWKSSTGTASTNVQSVDAMKIHDRAFRIRITLSGTMAENAKNNTPVSIQCDSINITFS